MKNVANIFRTANAFIYHKALLLVWEIYYELPTQLPLVRISAPEFLLMQGQGIKFIEPTSAGESCTAKKPFQLGIYKDTITTLLKEVIVGIYF